MTAPCVIEHSSDRIFQLVEPGLEIELCGTGFVFTEGPIWHPDDHYLLFSDMPGDTRRRWDESGGVRVVASPSYKGNGMTFDADLNLLVCEHATSMVVRMDATGTGDGRTVLASTYEGRELNSPNDIVVHSSGDIYFTDPEYGRISAASGVIRDRELEFQGVFKLNPATGVLMVVADDVQRPNGLCFSPDESILYVNDPPNCHIRAFDISDVGVPSKSRIFASGIGSYRYRDRGVTDGMKCDELGNVWVTGPGGIWVFSADGEYLGLVVIAEKVGNFHWGGSDWDWIYVAASTSLYRFRTHVRGRREPFMGERGR